MDGKECLERLAKQEKVQLSKTWKMWNSSFLQAGTESFYIMSLDNDIVIDARLKANMVCEAASVSTWVRNENIYRHDMPTTVVIPIV